MKAVVSLRVSTDEQSESGAGLAAQLDACRRWCDKLGAELVGPFEDNVSGAAGLEHRQGLMQALGQLGKGDVLLVAKRDRLGRDPVLVAMVEAAANRKGARVVSAAGEGTDGDSPTDVLMRRIVDAFAEYERLVIKARTKAALQAKISRNERCGKIRFGFILADDGTTLLPVLDEQEAIGLIRELKAAGQSLRDIATELTRRGICTKEGRPQWTHTAVARILARAA